MGFHDRRFPNETKEYRAARDALLEAEAALRERLEEVARRRRELPFGGPVPEDYVFETMSADGRVEAVRLSELFAPGRRSLVLYSFMYGPKMERPCPMCTSIVDGLEATAPHARQRIGLAVVARSPIERIVELARSRGWRRIPLLSSRNNRYNADYWAEDDEENQWPMLNVFVRTEDGVRHFWGSELLYVPWDGGEPRHADLVWPLWNLLDLTPEGRGRDWYPRLSYEG